MREGSVRAEMQGVEVVVEAVVENIGDVQKVEIVDIQGAVHVTGTIQGHIIEREKVLIETA